MVEGEEGKVGEQLKKSFAVLAFSTIKILLVRKVKLSLISAYYVISKT